MTATWSPPNWLWGYFIPVGLLLLTWGGLEQRKARRITASAGLSFAITALCYWAVGFAFHMGGAQAIHPEDPALSGLGVLFTLIPDQPGWGFVGLDAFFLSGETIGPDVYGFFLSYLPLVTTSVLSVSLALNGTRRWFAITSSVLTASIVLPIALCWAWGSGWLAYLGDTMGYGSGYVDFGGSSLVLWIPSLMVMGFLVVQQKLPKSNSAPLSFPKTQTPLVSNLGALLMGLGWMGWVLSNPFHIADANIHWQRTALNLLLGMAGAALTSQLYAWLTSGSPEALLAARGLAAGWAVLLVGAPFLTPWLAFVLGLISGLIFPFVHYVMETRSNLRSAAATLAIGITAGPIGAFSVALFADGRWGQGWNNTPKINELTDSVAAVSGVSGLFVTRDISQLKAQVIGLVALGLWGLIWGLAYGLVVRLFSRQPLQDKELEDESESDELDSEVPISESMLEDISHPQQHIQESEVLDKQPLGDLSPTNSFLEDVVKDEA